MFKFISNSNHQRRFAISDIHGCYEPLKNLLFNQLKITPNDQIFLLGDLISKGRNSAKVLDLLMDLQQANYQIFPLKGNHEQRLLIAFDCGFDFFENYLEKANCEDLIDGNMETYLSFINGFEYVYELDKFVLSHVGFDEKANNLYTDMRGMFSRIDFQVDENMLLKTQIHGHIVRTIDEIKADVQNKVKRFSIDSGCYLNNDEYGYLTALNLDSYELYFQRNKYEAF